ncbi:MAG: L-threonylcarbamoyladenylate synthase [Saprospiraceae bacterium]|jgi:L-threonylcarbamoyladenylate synthase|nr:threonylcarbamoyl-AMP synthase [Lewinellaceae bacterium]
MTRFTTAIGADPDQAAAWLLKGNCVAVPTETVYGLAANALDPAAVVRIFEIKNRPAFDPLIVHVTGLEQAQGYAEEIPAPLRSLAEYFWPGPLTILVSKGSNIPDLVTSGLPRVALRAPAHPLAQALLHALPFPLAAPSANPFGYISPTTAKHVFDQLQGKIPYILDGGPCRVGVESTIVGFENGQTTVYRLGGLAIEKIEAHIGPVQVQLNQSSNPAAPGMLKSHYAPRKPMILLEKTPWPDEKRRIGLLTLRRRTDLPEHALQIVLSETGDLAEAAQNLFAALRTLDQADIDLIVAESLPEEGLGRAINDRLRRAAAQE